MINGESSVQKQSLLKARDRHSGSDSTEIRQASASQSSLRLSLSQIGLAFRHHLGRCLVGEIGIGQSTGETLDLLLSLGNVLVQTCLEGIEINQSFNRKQNLKLTARSASSACAISSFPDVFFTHVPTTVWQ